VPGSPRCYSDNRRGKAKGKGKGLTGACQFLTIPGTIALCDAQNRVRTAPPVQAPRKPAWVTGVPLRW